MSATIIDFVRLIRCDFPENLYLKKKKVMSAWIWVLIPLVAIIGGYIIDYQKNKLKWQNQTNSNEAELEDLKKLTDKLKSRIENLEAIAANDPEEFTSQKSNSFGSVDIDIDDRESQHEKNRSKVENIAKKKQKQR